MLSSAWGAAALACVCQALFWQTVLCESVVGTQFLSGPTWQALTTGLGARLVPTESGQPIADPGPPLRWVLLGAVVAAGGLAGLCATVNGIRGVARRGDEDSGWRWWWWLGGWEAARLICDLSGWTSLGTVILSSASLVQIAAWSGFVATRLVVFPSTNRGVGSSEAARTAGQASSGPRMPGAVWGIAAVYFVTFAVLNWRLWVNLLIPHGDSAMYEEHLWNLLHGKGFRSYLDNGRLFLGEHIQVIHAALVPLYVVWPSHLLLEFTQSLALAATAIPAYRLARRFGGSERAAVLFAAAVLCYLPLQFLDIAIDFKTFRPNAFEIPFLLFGLEALERGRYRMFSLWAGLTLLCQEDAAPALAPLGVWIALTRGDVAAGSAIDDGWRRRLFGLALAAAATAYLLLVLKLFLPWFRGGADVHFAQYFSDLGGSTSEIVWTVVTQPWRLLVKWCQPDVAMFAVLLLAPLGFLPLASPGRLLVAVPLFLVLALNQLSRSPVHHFHAPLVPVLIWSAAAGLAQTASLAGGFARVMARFRRSAPATNQAEKLRDPARRFPREAIRPRSGNTLPVVRSGSGGDASSSATGYASEVTSAMSEEQTLDEGQFGRVVWRSRFAFGCAVGLMALSGFTPLGIPFWDSGSRAYWRTLYVESPRARAAEAVVAAIPPTERVASTDFIHPRFTHYARSYDYSDYRPEIPPDANWLVIDTGHPYSTIKRPDQVKEYTREPREWELVPIDPDGWFLVFRRVSGGGTGKEAGAGE